jgi:tol-pal system protein YbgF
MMLNRKALILALGLWSVVATAQVPVVEAGGRGAQNSPQAGGGNELVMTLYTQLDALQQEVQALRGLVEEQSNQLRRIQTEQRDRYLDVDRRLSALTGGAAAQSPALTPDATSVPGTAPAPGAIITPPPAAGGTPAVTPGFNSPPATNPADRSPSIVNSSPAPGTTPAAVDPALAGAQTADAQMSEQDLYRTALNLLLEQSQYDESVRLFQAYIDRFPQGRLLTNAYYWQGEALILVSRFEQARDVFLRLVNEYPEDPKAAGALLKLGVVYQQMGDRARAEETWRNIATRYPENVTEIRAAQDYLDRR